MQIVGAVRTLRSAAEFSRFAATGAASLANEGYTNHLDRQRNGGLAIRGLNDSADPIAASAVMPSDAEIKALFPNKH